jgi:GrpB-like predicted nucleotidyltransferase (UPF0157 family)
MVDSSPPVPVELHPHNPAWTEAAVQEATRLANALGDVLTTVHHIGSTAISGIVAKPIIDLLPVVQNLKDLDAKADAVRGLGYDWRGEFGIPGRRYCTLTRAGRRLFHLHFFERDSLHISRHLAFRDYLRRHPEQARAYEIEKRRAATLHPDDMNAYCDAKALWIEECERRALAWHSSQSTGN